MRWKYLKWQLPFQPVMKISPISLVYTSVTNCRRQSPTVLSLEQATMCVIASRRSNALELSESIKCTTKWSIHGIKIQMRIQMRIQVSLLTPRNNIVCASWMATHIVSMISGWPICLGREYSRYWLACAYHLFQSFRRCFSMNSPTFWRFSNQGNGGMHKFVNLDV